MDLIYRFDPLQPLAHTTPATYEDALESMRQGNERFVTFLRNMQQATLGQRSEEQIIVPVSPVSLGLPTLTGGAVTQAPFGLVLGCSDARVPVEHIFDLAFNSLFVIRIAGNVLGTECVASVDYAARNFSSSLKFIAVLGHSSCGAVTAAVDTYLRPNDYSGIACTYALRSLVDRLQIAVRGAAHSLRQEAQSDLEKHPRYREMLIDAAVYLNAAITSFDLRREMRTLESNPHDVIFGVFNLDTQLVRGLPATSECAAPAPVFLTAPRSADDLMALSTSISRGVLAKLADSR
jgi:carbonic anhydrase